MAELSNGKDVTVTTDSAFGVEMNRDIPIGDGERAISVLYALQKERESSADSGSVEYLDPELTAQIDSFSMYDVVIETLRRLQMENVCPAVPITPQTRLEELFPAKGRERNWKRFILDLQYQDWETGRAEFLKLPPSVSKFISPINIAFVVILVLSIPIGILNAFNVIECFPQWLRFAYFWICQLLYFYLGIYILIYFILDYLPFRFYTNVFKQEYDTVEKLSRYLKEINLFRITDPDAETLAKSGCPICKKILDFLSRQSSVPEGELNLQSRLDSLFHGNKAYSVWNGLLEEMTKEKFNLPYQIPLLLSSRSVIIKWFLNFLSWFVAAGFAIGVGYVVYFGSFNISKTRDFLIDRIPFLTNCLYMWILFSLVSVTYLLAATLIMAIIAMFDYFLFPKYDFPVRYQTVANLVNRFHAANVEWLTENCPESLDNKLRTLAFPNAQQKEVIEKLKSELSLEEEQIEDF
ncbi:MAG: hypothetical protein IKW80_11370 [Thermoguttaceae bacterium]|nr:hypothetical protein [Thermoguttaceae bacterium]